MLELLRSIGAALARRSRSRSDDDELDRDTRPFRRVDPYARTAPQRIVT